MAEQAELCQIIHDDYSFNASIKDDMAHWEGNFLGLGFDYNIVSILGPQSGGKSTLLNMLFHTNFAIMDEQRRQQTTRGLWLAHDADKQVLVMDVEGTDSKERGEKHINFDRKSALFSLAISEVLIINMWANDVGRYSAANYETLRMVFEINLKLFHTAQSPKTLLLFILRDHQATPLQNLAATLLQDMQNIWAEISKPEEHKNSDITQLFDFEFTSLPNYIYERQKFERGVEELAERFQRRDKENTFFKPAYSKRIPADGFAEYASTIWAKIISNKDLDLPTVKEMLATVRCEEIAQAAVKEAKTELESTRSRLESGHVVEGLGATIRSSRDAKVAAYDKLASLYLDTVYQGRREVLLEQLDEFYAILKKAQLANLVARNRKHMEDELGPAVADILGQARPNTWQKIGERVAAFLTQATDTLRPAVQELDLDAGGWDSVQTTLWGQAVECVRKQCQQQISIASSTMLKRFENSFKFDEDRVPREWDKDVDIKEIYSQSRATAAELVDVLRELRLPGVTADSDGATEELLTDAQAARLLDTLDQDARPLYEEALLRQRRGMAGQAPPVWAVLLIFILGFNELMAAVSFVSNPANLLMVLLGVVVVAVLYGLHALHLMGPVEAMAKAMLAEGMYQLQNGLQLLTEKMHDGAAKAADALQDKNAVLAAKKES